LHLKEITLKNYKVNLMTIVCFYVFLITYWSSLVQLTFSVFSSVCRHSSSIRSLSRLTIQTLLSNCRCIIRCRTMINMQVNINPTLYQQQQLHSAAARNSELQCWQSMTSLFCARFYSPNIQCEFKKSPLRGPDIFSFLSQTVENF